MEIITGIILIGGVLGLIAIPLLTKVDEDYILEQKLSLEEGDKYHQLLYKKENILTAIKDIEFDYETGKLSEDDYKKTRGDFEHMAIEVVKEIEQFTKKAKEVKKNKQQKRKKSFCPSCGEKLSQAYKFCPACGKSI
ncbi:MAG: zinc ribbon domain-containing protein [Nitrospinae bacterium]|nr:zinc ribbon domain-containing protein [Nitrospinota bacterium]